MIGYYVHHHGSGHASRATAIARELDEPVTGLSSLPRPSAWPGDWVQLPLDSGDAEDDARAQGRLHWVPLGSEGLRDRTARVSSWIASARPRALVVDVSVEVALLGRLHGVPIAVVALPGTRDDEAHRLGFEIASVILAAWPPEAADVIRGLSPAALRRLVAVGAIGGTLPERGEELRSAPLPRRALVLAGSGGDDFTAAAVLRAQRSAPEWTWEHLGGSGAWVDDVRPRLDTASVVITHAGQGALADVAAARRPAIVIPQSRPHDEQLATARALRSGDWPALVLDRCVTSGWQELLERASALDGAQWASWNDGGGAARAAAAIAQLAGLHGVDGVDGPAERGMR